MGLSSSKLVSEKEEGLGCKGNLDEGGDEGEMRMEVMDHDLEVITAASNKFNSLAQHGIKVEGDFGSGLATVRKHMEGFKRRYLDGELKRETLEGENAELKDQVRELKRRLEEKDGALDKMREDHLLELNQRVTMMEPRQEAQVQAGCWWNPSVPIGDDNLREAKGGDVVTEKVVRLIDRKREYWESSGSSSDSDGESTDSDDEDDMGRGSLRREIPIADPSPAARPTANEGDVDKLVEKKQQLARAERTPTNEDRGEQLVGPPDVRRSRRRGGSDSEEQGEVALELEESVQVGNSPGCVSNSQKGEKPAVTVSSQVRSSVGLRARSSQGLIVAKQSKFADFQVKSLSRGEKHRNRGSSCQVSRDPDPQPEQTRNFVCPTCTKAFPSRSNLNLHMRATHSHERPFQCPQCPARFKFNYRLSRHIVVHSDQKPFKCPKCPVRFKRKDEEKSHMLFVHSNRRPFKCQVCGAGFKLKHRLTIHLRIHTGERPHSCHICNKSFIEGGNLKRHVRSHLGEEGKIHQCPFCTIKFVNIGNCRAHQRRHHKSELGSEAVTTKS